jgi:spore germination protein KC
MKKWTQIISVVLSSMILSLPLHGCWGVRELNALSIVLGIGIDMQSSEPDKVFMTSQIVKPEALKKASSGQGEQNQNAKAYWNLKSSGSTIFDAIRENTHETNSKLYDAHNEIIIFGKDAAESGVQKYLDFFQRAQETRPTTEIVVSETSASEVLDVSPELDILPAVNIQKLVKAQIYNAQSREVTLQEFTNDLLSKSKAPVAPLVHKVAKDGTDTLIVKGLAVFKGDKMVGELDENESRGLIWVEGLVKTGVIDLSYLDGKVSIEIKSSESKITSQVRDRKVYINISIKEDGVIATQTCIPNMESISEIAILENLEQATIEQEILNTVTVAKRLNTDFFGFGEELHKYHPEDWNQMEGEWDTIFPTIQVTVHAVCKIHSAGNITQPSIAQ